MKVITHSADKIVEHAIPEIKEKKTEKKLGVYNIKLTKLYLFNIDAALGGSKQFPTLRV